MTAHTVCTTYVYESGLSSLNNPELQTTMRDFKDKMGKKDEVHHSLALLYVVLSLLMLFSRRFCGSFLAGLLDVEKQPLCIK